MGNNLRKTKLVNQFNDIKLELTHLVVGILVVGTLVVGTLVVEDNLAVDNILYTNLVSKNKSQHRRMIYSYLVVVDIHTQFEDFVDTVVVVDLFDSQRVVVKLVLVALKGLKFDYLEHKVEGLPFLCHLDQNVSF